MMSQVSSGSVPRFCFQIWWDKVVEFMCDSCLNECVCDVYLFLKFSVLPIYILGGFSAVVAS